MEELTFSQEDIKALLGKLRSYERTPYRIKEFWKEAQIIASFVQGGFAAWLVYHAAKHESEQADHCTGKSDRTRIIKSIFKATPDSLNTLVSQVKTTIQADEGFSRKIESWDQRTQKKRARLNEGSSRANSLSMNQGQNSPECNTDNEDDTPHPPKRLRTETSEGRAIGTAPLPTSIQTLSDEGLNDVQSVTNVTKADEYDRENASLDAADRLFPPEFYNDIRRKQDLEGNAVAAIKTTLPAGLKNSKVGYRMVIDITPENVPQYASKWFGVTVKTRGTTQYVYCQGGGEVQGDKTTIVQAFLRSQIADFGAKVSHAISQNPVYLDEAQLKRSRTRSVSLSIPKNPRDPGQLMIYMGGWDGTGIVHDLYPKA